jgi:hypothetical protein
MEENFTEGITAVSAILVAFRMRSAANSMLDEATWLARHGEQQAHSKESGGRQPHELNR